MGDLLFREDNRFVEYNPKNILRAGRGSQAATVEEMACKMSLLLYAKYEMQNSKYEMQNSNCKLQIAKCNCKMQNTKYEMQNAKCKMQNSKYKMQNAKLKM